MIHLLHELPQCLHSCEAATPHDARMGLGIDDRRGTLHHADKKIAKCQFVTKWTRYTNYRANI